MKQFDVVTALVKIRRDEMEVKPMAESLDGLRSKFRALWEIEDDDNRYPGEWAMQPIDPETVAAFDQAEVAWIASGDLAIEQPNAEITGADRRPG